MRVLSETSQDLAIARAWIDAWVAREQRAVVEREHELARSSAEVTERGLAAGVFTAPELADAKAFLAEADVRRTDIEGEITRAGFVLARAMAKPWGDARRRRATGRTAATRRAGR
jgi:outer membrane protein TolC